MKRSSKSKKYRCREVVKSSAWNDIDVLLPHKNEIIKQLLEHTNIAELATIIGDVYTADSVQELIRYLYNVEQ